MNPKNQREDSGYQWVKCKRILARSSFRKEIQLKTLRQKQRTSLIWSKTEISKPSKNQSRVDSIYFQRTNKAQLRCILLLKTSNSKSSNSCWTYSLTLTNRILMVSHLFTLLFLMKTLKSLWLCSKKEPILWKKISMDSQRMKLPTLLPNLLSIPFYRAIIEPFLLLFLPSISLSIVPIPLISFHSNLIFHLKQSILFIHQKEKYKIRNSVPI